MYAPLCLASSIACRSLAPSRTNLAAEWIDLLLPRAKTSIAGQLDDPYGRVFRGLGSDSTERLDHVPREASALLVGPALAHMLALQPDAFG